MKNRIPNYLPASKTKAQPLPSTRPELLDLVQKQIADRMRVVEAYVHKYPVAGIGAVFCIGIILGWFIKRH
jgi:ElaB/YqjD/DUF883 family membrane-anchored ribosome-binding protein